MAWFWRYTPMWHIWKGEEIVFCGFEETMTPLWFWDV